MRVTLNGRDLIDAILHIKLLPWMLNYGFWLLNDFLVVVEGLKMSLARTIKDIVAKAKFC